MLNYIMTFKGHQGVFPPEKWKYVIFMIQTESKGSISGFRRTLIMFQEILSKTNLENDFT